jgi:lipopolysaccharide export system permease protein
MHLNSSVAPESAYARRSIRRLVSLSDILAVIEPGKFIDDFPGVQFFVGARDDQKLTDVRIIEPLGPGQKREIKAKTAYISSEEGRIKLDLSDVSINPISKTNSDVGHAARVVRYLGDEINEGRGSEVPRRLKDRLSADLLTEVLVARDSPPALDDEEAVLTLSQVRTELSNRTVMALSCLCFILIGIPLGIKTHRRESTIGVVIALAVAAAFFLFLIAAESLAKMPRFYPDLIAWVPVVVSFVLSNVLVFRNP